MWAAFSFHLRAQFLGLMAMLPMTVGFLWHIWSEAFVTGAAQADKWADRLIADDDKRKGVARG